MKKFANEIEYYSWSDGPKVFIDTKNQYEIDELPFLDRSIVSIQCDVDSLEDVIETLNSSCPMIFLNADIDVLRLVTKKFTCNVVWVVELIERDTWQRCIGVN